MKKEGKKREEKEEELLGGVSYDAAESLGDLYATYHIAFGKGNIVKAREIRMEIAKAHKDIMGE